MPSPAYIANLMVEELKRKGNLPSTNTLVQYTDYTIIFLRWCKERYRCRKPEDAKIHLQEYADYLTAKGLSAPTVRTYMAGCCRLCQVSASQLKLPDRHWYTVTQNRGTKEYLKRSDTKREASPKLYDLALAVGERRHDYLALRGNNWTVDESGYPCVEIVKSKGGKHFLARVLEPDVERVASYFDGTDNYVFTWEEMNNKIRLHKIRAEAAQRAYDYYLHRIETEPGYREQLTEEIRLRWVTTRGIPPQKSKKNHNWEWDEKRVQGVYRLRGENRKKAIERGQPTEFLKLAVMAVSLFHTSHFRCDVTINSYILTW